MITLIKNRKTDYTIALPNNASVVEKKVADELATYIDKVFGLRLPIVSETMALGNAIYVGHTEYAKENGVTGDSTENWIVCVKDKNVILTGGLTNKDRGIAYSVYHFLEDVVGIRWWTWFEEYIPKTDVLEMPDDYKNSGTPYFEYRNICDTFKPVDYSYVAHRRLNAWTDTTDIELIANPEFTSRGGIKYIAMPHSSHTMPRMIPAEEYHSQHPEWFAYDPISGTRDLREGQGACYCMTNEELIEFTAEKVIGYLDKHTEFSKKYDIEMPCFFSLTLGDSRGYCKCEKCKPIIENSGFIGLNIRFVNAVARIVKKKYPNILLQTEAYWEFIDPPKDGVALDENVLLQYSDLKVDLLRDVESKSNSKGLKLLNAWSDICAEKGASFYIWDFYLQQYPNIMMPYFLKLPKNFRYFYEKGIRGCFMEHEVDRISDFYTMSQWFLTKLLENPYEDAEALTEDFTTKYYGDAAPFIRKYIDLLAENLAENESRTLVYMQTEIGNYVNYKTVKEGLKLLSEAENAVRKDELRLKRVHVVETCLYRTIAMNYGKFETLAKRCGEALGVGREEMIDLTIKYLKENANVYTMDDGTGKYKEHNESLKNSVEEDIAFMERLKSKKVPKLQIPDELLKFGEENVYVVSGAELFGNTGCGAQPEGHRDYEKLEYVEELGHECLKLSLDEIPALGRMYMYLAGSKNDETLNPMVFYTEGHNENVRAEYYQEDLVKEEFCLLHIGEITNVTPKSATIFQMFDHTCYSVGICDLYEIFPSDNYDIYVKLKVSGSKYGGCESSENALYIDAVFIARK